MKNTLLKSAEFLVIFLGCSVGCSSSSSKNQLIPLVQSSTIPTQESITLNINNYLPSGQNSFREIFVSNFSVVNSGGTPYLSTARDGLPDIFKTNIGASYNFSVNTPYSPPAGVNNLVLRLLGISVTPTGFVGCSVTSITNVGCKAANNCTGDGFTYSDTRLPGSPNVFLGLTDCEKRYINLSPNTIDTNGNSVPDYLKLRCGLNPLDPNDGNVSMSNDQLNNIQKCKSHLPIDESADSPANKTLAYQYTTTANSDGSKNFSISNIVILNGGQDNFIAIYIVESQPTTVSGAISQVEQLSSAYFITASGSAGKTFTVPYWGFQTGYSITAKGF